MEAPGGAPGESPRGAPGESPRGAPGEAPRGAPGEAPVEAPVGGPEGAPSGYKGSSLWALEERERLRFVNRFVLSLYEDLGALLQANAATQLKKIRLLCMQAIEDVSKLNEYVSSKKRYEETIG